MPQFHSFDDMLGDYLSVMPDDPKITGAASLFEANSDVSDMPPMFESMYSTEDYLRALDIVKKWKVPSKLSPMVVGALAIVLGACSAGKLVESRPFARKAMQTMASLTTRNPDEMTPEDTVKVNDTIEMAQDTGFAPADPEAPVEKPMYVPGDNFAIPLIDLGSISGEFSTNESIRCIKSLEPLLAIDRADTAFLSGVRVIVHIIDPNNPKEKDILDSMHTTTAFTTGLDANIRSSAIHIYSIPVPNQQSLANLLSHEIKHPFPAVVANIIRLNPKYRGAVSMLTPEALDHYAGLLDSLEHIDKSGDVWKVDGIQRLPMDIMRESGMRWVPDTK